MGPNPCNHALTRADRWCQGRIFAALFGILLLFGHGHPVCATLRFVQTMTQYDTHILLR